MTGMALGLGGGRVQMTGMALGLGGGRVQMTFFHYLLLLTIF